MTLRALACIAATMAAGSEIVGAPLTFEEALALAGKNAGDAAAAAPLRAEISALRRSRLPSVRAEVTTNASRTLDLFSEGPLEVRYATSVLAFDYPLWGRDPAGARIDALEAKLRRVGAGGGLDDSRFAQILGAFGDLYVAQRQTEVLRPIAERVEADVTRAETLLSTGEISNLAAIERREIALAYKSRLLDLEARRIDAAARLRLLTGLEEEPAIVLGPATVPPGATASAVRDDVVDDATIAVEESRVRLQAVRSSTGFGAMLSGFAGVGAAESEFRAIQSSGSFGVYGLRLHLSYPIIGGTSGIAIAEARAALAQSIAVRDEAIKNASARAAEYQLRADTSARRIALLEESVAAARAREDSLRRLVAGGLRTEGDLAQAQEERIRRELDAVAVAVERWKAAQLLARMISGSGPVQP